MPESKEVLEKEDGNVKHSRTQYPTEGASSGKKWGFFLTFSSMHCGFFFFH